MKIKDHLALVAAVVLALGLLAGISTADPDPESETAGTQEVAEPLPDPKQVGGEDASVVQVANLIYARVKSSKCFSDHFLVRADEESAVSTSRRFHAVKAESDDLFQYPFVIMTGEGSFKLTETERANLRRFCENGGFLLASAGCSSTDWDRSFRREIGLIWPGAELSALPMSHPVFHTVNDINRLKTKHGKPSPLEGISIDGTLVAIYSKDGLNDTRHTSGCCCCGGNELVNAEQINVNILGYALAF